MPTNKHVLKASARETMIRLTREAFAEIGIDLGKTTITPHLIGSVTVVLSDAQLHAARAKIAGMRELTGHGNSGRIEIVLPTVRAYVVKNRPTLTEEERQAKKAGTGNGVSAEERAARAALRAELEAELKDAHGIDLSENRTDSAAE